MRDPRRDEPPTTEDDLVAELAEALGSPSTESLEKAKRIASGDSTDDEDDPGAVDPSSESKDDEPNRPSEGHQDDAPER